MMTVESVAATIKAKDATEFAAVKRSLAAMASAAARRSSAATASAAAEKLLIFVVSVVEPQPA